MLNIILFLFFFTKSILYNIIFVNFNLFDNFFAEAPMFLSFFFLTLVEQEHFHFKLYTLY